MFEDELPESIASTEDLIRININLAKGFKESKEMWGLLLGNADRLKSQKKQIEELKKSPPLNPHHKKCIEEVIALETSLTAYRELVEKVKEWLECASLQNEREPDYIRISLQAIEQFEKGEASE